MPTPPESVPEPSISPAEAAYLRILGAAARGEASALDELCREQPELAEGLRRLEQEHQEFRDQGESSVFSRGLAHRLLDKYDDLLGAEPAALPVPEASDLSYEVKGEVARGGMGVIHEVWDPILRRSLAMKRVREDGTGSPDNRMHRFLREARITAQLDHPGVVPVHELRIDPQGAPYFTMRLVRGRDLRTVLRWARDGRHGWNLTRALEVLIKVCDTLAYAHSHGVLHRDLKPANVMVGEFGEVYVMDWGLAKVIGEADDDRTEAAPFVDEPDQGDMTMAGSILGTPSYMAPEQAHGEQVGPAADVYAVGSMLYLLLAGHPPYGSSSETTDPAQILAALRKGPPKPIREDTPGISFRLAGICEKAMAREIEARTPGMTALADALRGHLQAEQEAVEEAERAKEEAQRAGAVSSFLTELFRRSDPASHQGREVTAREILDRGAERLREDLPDQPIVQAELMYTMGNIYYNLGLYEQALELQESALDIRRRVAGEETREVLDSLVALSAVRQVLADLEGAERLARQSLDLIRRLDGPDHENAGIAASNLAVVLQGQGTFPEAKSLLHESIRVLELVDTRHDSLGQVYNNLGSLLGREDRNDEAVPWYRRALAHNREVLGESHPEVAVALNNLAGALGQLEEHEEAERCYRDALTLRRRIFGDEHPKVATSLNSLGHYIMRSGRYEEAEELLQEAHALHVRTRGEEHPSVASANQNLARLFRDTGRLQEAEELARKAVALYRRVPGHDLASTLQTLGLILLDRGKLAEADEVLGEAVQWWCERDAPDNPGCIDSIRTRARVLLRSLRFEDAATLLEEALETRPDHPGRARLQAYLPIAWAAQGRESDALRLGRESRGDCGDAPGLRMELEGVAQIAADAGLSEVVERLQTLRRSLDDGSGNGE